VVLLPDTVLLVPGAAGRADPGAGLRAASLAALAAVPSVPPGGRVLVVAPGRRGRFLPHPVGPGLGAAGLDLGLDPTSAVHRADVPASVALALLEAAGVPGEADVLEVERVAVATQPTPGVPTPATPFVDRIGLLVVVGSLSARHGPDAPLADDPRAPAADASLLAALASGPAALATALDDLGADGARDLVVTGAAPWRVALDLIGVATPVDVVAHHHEVLLGAQHAVTAWIPAPTTEEPR
jgi:hypothetical protein